MAKIHTCSRVKFLTEIENLLSSLTRHPLKQQNKPIQLGLKMKHFLATKLQKYSIQYIKTIFGRSTLLADLESIR